MKQQTHIPASPLYYLGPEETYSHHAARLFAAEGFTPQACGSFREVFDAMLAEPGARAVVPFENSIQGPVTEIMDLLGGYDTIEVVNCLALPIRHTLLTLDETTPLREIHSHPQALAQCREHLLLRYPGIPLVAVESTAKAACDAVTDPGIGAIASEATAARYALFCRDFEIQDETENLTRFFLLAQKEASRPPAKLPPTHTLFHLLLDDKPGALVRLLTPFHLLDVNLTFIQSRPLRGEHWKYAFTIEAETGICKLPLSALLNAIRPHTRTLRVLGSYSTQTAQAVAEGTEMTTLASIRMMIASLDEKLVTALCARARYRRNAALYADDGSPCSPETISRRFAAEPDKLIQTRSLRPFYIRTILPLLCKEGEDANPRQALSADTDSLNALAQRFNFATHIIARKRVELGNALHEACVGGDRGCVEAALINPVVEDEVLARVIQIAREQGADQTLAETIRRFYIDYVLPISRQIQVSSLLETHV